MDDGLAPFARAAQYHPYADDRTGDALFALDSAAQELIGIGRRGRFSALADEKRQRRERHVLAVLSGEANQFPM